MSPPVSVAYVDAKARVVRAINRVNTFVHAMNEFNKDRLSAEKRAKIKNMLTELNNIRKCVEEDVQLMETAVGNKSAPNDVIDCSASNSLIDSFDSLYYDLAAFADINQMSLFQKKDVALSENVTMSQPLDASNSFLQSIQYPKRKFPTFSGNMKEWQNFEQLFTSILSHTPHISDVEKFEILKTSLEGEAQTLVSHLSLTIANYHSAWEILRARYGNKRDLARIHFEPLLASYIVKANDASSIKNLLNCILEHTAALDNLDFVTRQWSPILIHIFEKHLDRELRARWETTVGEKHNPKLNEFVDFLRRQIRTADIHSIPYSTAPLYSQQKQVDKQSKFSNAKCRSQFSSKVLATTAAQSLGIQCILCKQSHSIRKCPQFTNKTAQERFQIAKSHHLCINCLGLGHSSVSCSSKNKCQTCNRSHHTLLHFGSSSSPTTAATCDEPSTSSLVVRGQPQRIILLSTILFDVLAANGTRKTFRALLDSGSQASFMTEHCANLLMVKKCPSNVKINTFANHTSTTVRGKSNVTLVPRGSQSPSVHVEVLIVTHITEATPHTSLMHKNWPHLNNLSLADPLYNVPGSIDLLLGADVLPEILLDGKISGKPGQPIAMETIFGWTLIGPVEQCNKPAITSLNITVSDTLDTTLKKFWEIEEMPSTRHFSLDDKMAEQIYQETTTRVSSGRFMVTIPFRTPRPILGDSKSIALRRFKFLEARLNNNQTLRDQYINFMKDYLTAGHMELVPLAEIATAHAYYIPHHCVLRPDSNTTKLRVVFNASARTSAGLSLNESMYTGPKLQPDIQAILLRARIWKYLFITDVKQMYRQILVQPTDRDYLRIFWRFSQNDPISEYRLCTVTYGTSAAPFQALRTIRELANVDGQLYPQAAEILLNDTFVDDIITGANSEKNALDYQTQLIKLCSLAQFELRKWASNSSQVLQAVSENARAMSPSLLLNKSEQSDVKVLGLRWDPKTDNFSFLTQSTSTTLTKRSILSDIARVFDPLGLLSPVTFLAKHIMQLLWTAGTNWDDPVPTEIQNVWKRYQTELKCIEDIEIPRRITRDEVLSVQLHAFCDSSEKGYAAAVYIRIHTSSGISCQLIIGKSKVAPLKKYTIPRLELCGALLAAKLLRFVVETISNRLNVDCLFAWTDSTTVLAWLKSSPHRWQTFVANRTSQIQDLTPPSIWHYVPTQQNPVDCASRGLYPEELKNHPLWWSGPLFLKNPQEHWPSSPTSATHDSNNSNCNIEEKTQTVLVVNVTTSIIDLLNRFSSLNKILRIIAYCRRFLTVRRNPLTPFTISISAKELSKAMLSIVYYVQRETYAADITCLLNGHRCSKNLRCLDPFIDEYGFVRVGGRLRKADVPFSQKHPLLLPCQHRLTNLLIDSYHQRLQHPGSIALQASLQKEYWIQSARKAIRSRLRLCVACFRTNPRCLQPKMADLPKYRVQQIKPFSISGVDYAGPITLKSTRGRRSPDMSAYICLFICMATKAIHLELSSDLSTEKFLMAFTRFVSRRGPIQEIHSDCGSNFIGASRLLKKCLSPLQALTTSADFQNTVHEQLSKRNISWYFNPPASPHFGGLWEAGVKSTKSLIYRSIGLHKLTSEEFSTLLTQIEATLNSRPLCALSTDPNDFNVLTPSHFLTFEPTTSLPEPSLENVSLSKLQRWRLILDIQNYFWSRWKNEYLSSLQLRRKWTDNHDQIQENDLVILKESTHPLHWKMGRVRQLHPGSDGVTRVATVETATSRFLRPLVKLCPLPTS
ncbi:uncharacterized protein LOC126898294 [Daktulosphaira vitifoliae]|uniref:uncharacterized protein LOC126898294 n=1 Tax=Daktulosphaira vitifoliae TaxID=58002 RepID=UPI0021A9AF60|nr:uncharacterized protein LOC126898294 [Daktulosphaira vitifoliae]